MTKKGLMGYGVAFIMMLTPLASYGAGGPSVGGGDKTSGMGEIKGEFKFGRVRFEPKLGLGLTYDDNVFLESDETESDYMYSFAPGFEVRYLGAPGNYFGAGYDLTFSFYNDYSDKNYQEHAPFITLGFKSPAGFYLKADDVYTNTSDSYGSENTYGEGRKLRRWNNNASFTLGYEFAKRFGLEGTYSNYLIRYSADTDAWQDRMDHGIGMAAFYRVASKTLILVEYQVTMADYGEQNDGIDSNGNGVIDPVYEWNSNNSRDYTLHDYFIGVRFEPGQKLLGEIKFGYGQKKFENDYALGGLEYSDQNSWVAETDFSYRPGRSTKLSFLFRRAHRGAPDADSTAYMDMTIGAALNQGIGDRISFDLAGEYTKMDYSDSSKYFDVYKFSTGMTWEIVRWLSAGLDYTYENKTANDDLYEDEEYKNNTIGFNFNATF